MINSKTKTNVSSTSKVSVKTNLEEYEEAIDLLAQAKSNRIFQNQNAEHAAIVIKKILENSKNEVAIFDDDLSGDVSDKSVDFLNVLRDSITKDGKTLRIAVKQRPHTLDSNIARTLRELVKLYPDKVQVKLASKEFLEVINSSVSKIGIKEHVNFAVGDNDSFRLEFPAGDRKAFCSFQNPIFSSVLLSIFEEKFNDCEDYFQEPVVNAAFVNAVK